MAFDPTVLKRERETEMNYETLLSNFISIVEYYNLEGLLRELGISESEGKMFPILLFFFEKEEKLTVCETVLLVTFQFSDSITECARFRKTNHETAEERYLFHKVIKWVFSSVSALS